MTEVADFTQDDLDEDDVMLLDTWEEVGLCVHASASACGCGDGRLGYAKCAQTTPLPVVLCIRLQCWKWQTCFMFLNHNADAYIALGGSVYELLSPFSDIPLDWQLIQPV